MASVTAPLTSIKPYPFLPVRPPKFALNPSSIIRNSNYNPEWLGLKTSCRRESLNLYCIRTKNSRIATVGIDESPLSEEETKQEVNTYRKIMLSNVEVTKERNDLWGRNWNLKDTGVAGILVAMHLLSLFAPFYFNWHAFWVSFVLAVFSGVLGITFSFHRNLSHKSFKLPKWLEYFFAYCGVHALQGDPISWVSTHRYHHQFCDTERDPHSPIEGFWHSHMNWLVDTNYLFEKGGGTTNVGDLQKQPFYRFLLNTYMLHIAAFGILLYALGGFPLFVWGMGVRNTYVYHVTWLVNSACHVWGNQAWNTGDLSRNNWWVALLTFGEGWHNNHHAFEYSARIGLEWWEIDLTWNFIRFLEAVGLATDVKLPTESHKQKMGFNN